MKARIYDPATCRFLSPDPYISDPQSANAYNRYAYCLNNPLSYVDPSGEWIHIVIGAVIGGVFNLVTKAIQGKIHSVWDGVAAFGIGAAAGAIGAATGGAAFAAAGGAAAGAGGFLAGAAGGAVGAAFSMPVQSIGNSAYFGDPMMTGKQYLMGIAGGALMGGVVNGGIAALNGKSFLTGSPKPSIANFQLVKLKDPNFDSEIKLPNQRSEIKQLYEGTGEIKEFHTRQLYLKELENPHMYSKDHIRQGLEEALSSNRLDGYDKVAKIVLDADKAGLLVRGSNQIRFVNNGFAMEARIFIDNNGVLRSLDAFVLTGNNVRNINNVVSW